MSYRVINIAGHEVIQPYVSCPVCGDDMQSVLYLGDICPTCYEKERDEKETNE